MLILLTAAQSVMQLQPLDHQDLPLFLKSPLGRKAVADSPALVVAGTAKAAERPQQPGLPSSSTSKPIGEFPTVAASSEPNSKLMP